jgi:hypothetical protein
MSETALKWAWRYGRLQVEAFDSLDDAIAAAGYASDDGQEAIDCVEVWCDDGYRRISGTEVLEMWRTDPDNEANQEPGSPPSTAVVIQHPDLKDSGREWFWDEDEAALRFGDLRRLLGDRVSVEPAPDAESPAARLR